MTDFTHRVTKTDTQVVVEIHYDDGNTFYLSMPMGGDSVTIDHKSPAIEVEFQTVSINLELLQDSLSILSWETYKKEED
jgi:hypothetical protein